MRSFFLPVSQSSRLDSSGCHGAFWAVSRKKFFIPVDVKNCQGNGNLWFYLQDTSVSGNNLRQYELLRIPEFISLLVKCFFDVEDLPGIKDQIGVAGQKFLGEI